MKPKIDTMLQRMLDETADGGTPCALTLEHARAALKHYEGEKAAWQNLQDRAELVLGDLNERKTGWYYQFSAAVEKIRNHFQP